MVIYLFCLPVNITILVYLSILLYFHVYQDLSLFLITDILCVRAQFPLLFIFKQLHLGFILHYLFFFSFFLPVFVSLLQL
jgi:hypothetical protein